MSEGGEASETASEAPSGPPSEASETASGPANRRRHRPPPPLAWWWERALAVVIDALVVAVVYLVLAVSISAAFSSVRVTASGDTETPVTTTGDIVLVVAAVVVALAYFGICHGLAPGQTLGARVLRIAVRDAATGRPLGYRRGLG
ncbi:MAG TPA: RDD family protein, partial [Acidimicrobiales bacterium]|nr:RDD family protein [Acidimicrobiales bacterium]